jgi:hypothetical protein
MREVWRLGGLRAWRICGLIAALLFAQTTGVLHRVAHSHTSLPSQVTSAQLPSAEHVPHHWLSHLWGDHGQRTDCQLFDQLANVAPPAQPIALAVLASPESHSLWLAQRPQTLFERFYSAQAPPVFL